MSQTNVIPFPVARAEAIPAFAPIEKTAVTQTFDINQYLPPTDPAKPISLVEESLGVHQIPHQIYEFLFKATESRVEMVVFACLLRYTSGFHRSTCEASTRFISDWTGVSETSVRNGLKPLLIKKLIVCTKKGSSAEDPSTYEIPVVKAYLDSIQLQQTPPVTDRPPKPASQVPVSSQKIEPKSPVETEAPRTTSAQYCALPMRGTAHPVCAKKYNININTKKTLSERAIENQNRKTIGSTDIPKSIADYFASVSLPHKLMKEQKHFSALKGHYSLQEIALGLEYVAKNGLSSGEICHSPMAFLACSMPNVLPAAKAELEGQQRQIQRQQELAEEKERERQKENEESAQYEADVAEFEKAYPSLEKRKEYFIAFSKRYPLFAGKDQLLRAAAIREWGSQRRLNSGSTRST